MSAKDVAIPTADWLAATEDARVVAREVRYLRDAVDDLTTILTTKATFDMGIVVGADAIEGGARCLAVFEAVEGRITERASE